MASKYLMNNVLRETSRIALIKSLQGRPSHDQNQANATLRHVQLGIIITDSRLDDELSVATIEFHHTPQWLTHDNSSFPKFTTLGTIWNAVDRSAVDEHGRTEFIRAVIKGGSHIEFLYVEMLAEFDDTDVNVQDHRGRTALHWACALSHHDMVRLCLSIPDCDTSLKDHDGLTAFDISLRSGSHDEAIPNLFYSSIMEMETDAPQTALLRILTISSEPAAVDKPVFPGQAMFTPVEDANEPLVAALIARGIDFTATNHAGDTALHMAAAKANNIGIVSKLVNAGWDVNAVGRKGATPLHCAIRARNMDVMKFLLDHEANLGAKDDYGHTPLKLAEDNKRKDKVRLLQRVPDIATTAVVTSEPLFGEITIHAVDAGMAERTGLHGAASDGYTASVPAGPAGIDGRNDLGHAGDSHRMNPLHRAARNGHTETVVAPLARGASIDQIVHRQAPLHLAAREGHTPTVLALPAGGANIDEGGEHVYRPLHRAARAGHTETVLALLAGGETVDRLTYDQRTPLHLAARNGHIETVSALLVAGANIDQLDHINHTPLHLAAMAGHTAIVSALIADGATVDLLSASQRSPLHGAAENGHTETVLAFLAGGANINQTGWLKNTPLHMAANQGHAEVVSALIAGGAGIDLVNGFQKTALHLAASRGHTQSVSALLAGGADIDLPFLGRFTALDMALHRGNKDMINILNMARDNGNKYTVNAPNQAQRNTTTALPASPRRTANLRRLAASVPGQLEL